MPSAGGRLGRSILVVSDDPTRREQWPRALRDGRAIVSTCAGPRWGCPLVEGGRDCPLVWRADLVIYDVETAAPEFVGRLMEAHPAAEFVIARDRTVAGRHRPTPVLRRAPHRAL